MGEIDRAGLVGHGGAAFPTGQKLGALFTLCAGRPFVIANGTEGEPASMKDRSSLPARLTSFSTALPWRPASLGLMRSSWSSIVMTLRESVDAALAERQRIRLDGTRFRVVTAADGFVAGEAGAVVNWVGRVVPIPLGKTPRMTEHGLRGRPTLVQNVETLAHLALVGRYGAEWFRKVGTADEPGTKLVTLAG